MSDPTKTVYLNGALTIRNEGSDGEEAELRIYDDIIPFWGIDAKSVRSQLDRISKSAPLNVRIHSNGGDVFEGFAIFNFIQAHEGRVVAHVDGVAASIASVIAVAADELVMAQNAFLMIHNPFAVMAGEADQLRSVADMLDKVTGVIVDSYMAKVDMEREEVEAAMADETWYSAEEALAVGFADRIVGRIEVAALAKTDRFNSIPRAARCLFEKKGGEANAQVDEDVLEALAGVVDVVSRKEEENEMSEEIKESLAALTKAVSSLSEQMGETSKLVGEQSERIEQIGKEAQEAKESAAATAANSRVSMVQARLDSAVKSGRVAPVMRDALDALVSGGASDEALEEFLEKLESAPMVNGQGLNQEVVRSNGKRSVVQVSQRHTQPGPGGTVRGPDPEAMAQYLDCAEGAKDFDDFRRRAYAAHGEPVPGDIAGPAWAEN